MLQNVALAVLWVAVSILIASIIDIKIKVKTLDEYVESISQRTYKVANRTEDSTYLEYKVDDHYIQVPLKYIVQELLDVHGFEVKKRNSAYVIMNKLGDKV
jgi:hypothetical protein